MEHKHDVIDQDCYFCIDPAKDMAITCEGTVKALKRGDHGAEVYSFRMPRYIEGHDMSTCNKVEVHYNNIRRDPSTRETTVNKSFAEAEGFGADQEDGDTVTWTWKPTGDATQLDGKLAFCVRFACMEGETITYQKFSGIFEAIPVGDTIHNTEEMAKEYADVLEAWRQEIMAMIGEGSEQRIVTVTLDESTGKANMTAGEIFAAMGEGKLVVADVDGLVSGFAMETEAGAYFPVVAPAVHVAPGLATIQYIIIVAEDGTYTQYGGDMTDCAPTVAYVEEQLAKKLTAPGLAKVGQVIVVKAVDDAGRPTDWEAVDLPAGGEKKWICLADVTIPKEDAVATMFVDRDANGQPFSVHQVTIVFEGVAVTDGTQSGKAWISLNPAKAGYNAGSNGWATKGYMYFTSNANYRSCVTIDLLKNVVGKEGEYVYAALDDIHALEVSGYAQKAFYGRVMIYGR